MADLQPISVQLKLQKKNEIKWVQPYSIGIHNKDTNHCLVEKKCANWLKNSWQYKQLPLPPIRTNFAKLDAV